MFIRPLPSEIRLVSIRLVVAFVRTVWMRNLGGDDAAVSTRPGRAESEAAAGFLSL